MGLVAAAEVQSGCGPAWTRRVGPRITAALAWSQMSPSDYHLWFLTVPNFWWQLGAVTLLVGLTPDADRAVICRDTLAQLSYPDFAGDWENAVEDQRLAVATRLALFLWNSEPDQPLRAVAARLGQSLLELFPGEEVERQRDLA